MNRKSDLYLTEESIGERERMKKKTAAVTWMDTLEG